MERERQTLYKGEKPHSKGTRTIGRNGCMEGGGGDAGREKGEGLALFPPHGTKSRDLLGGVPRALAERRTKTGRGGRWVGGWGK